MLNALNGKGDQAGLHRVGSGLLKKVMGVQKDIGPVAGAVN